MKRIQSKPARLKVTHVAGNSSRQRANTGDSARRRGSITGGPAMRPGNERRGSLPGEPRLKKGAMNRESVPGEPALRRSSPRRVTSPEESAQRRGTRPDELTPRSSALRRGSISREPSFTNVHRARRRAAIMEDSFWGGRSRNGSSARSSLRGTLDYRLKRLGEFSKYSTTSSKIAGLLRMTPTTNKISPAPENEIGANKSKDEPREYLPPSNLYIMQIRLPLFVRFFYYIGPYWEWILSFMIFTSYLLITYLAIFSLFLPLQNNLILVLDYIFLLDTVFRVVIEVWRQVTSTPCIILIVPYTFPQFILDTLSNVPMEWLYLWSIDPNDLNSIENFDYFRFNRFLRFSRIFAFFNVAVKERRISEILMFFVRYLTMYIAFIQAVACTFFALLPCDPLDFLLQSNMGLLDESWMRRITINKPGQKSEPWDHYILSLSFSAAVVTTTGYGDIAAISSAEMFVASLVMLIGAIFLSGLYSSGLTSFKLEHDGARFDLFFRVGAIIRHLGAINSAELFQNKVLEYYSLLWNYREGVYDVTFMAELPKAVIEDMFYDICQEMFYKAPLFRGLDETFLRAVAGIVQVVLYNPDMILCSAGSYAMNMFYLLQGEVRVKSKFNSDLTGGIMRAGCIIGEVNLFFSYPYTTTMETRTCCQLLMIRKFELFELFQSYKDTLEIIRGRVAKRLVDLQANHDLIGTEPVCWISYKDDIARPALEVADMPVVMRRGKGFNRLIIEDVIDDTSGPVIVDMPCTNKKFKKEHTTVFKTCVIPSILTTDKDWVRLWCVVMLIVSLYSAFLGPYCLVFHNADFEIMEYLCQADAHLEPIFFILYFIDIFVEITQSVPVSGLYFKLKDGFQVKGTQVSFWIDVLSALPFSFIKVESHELMFNFLTTIPRCLKIWKVFRYFKYLDNIHPDQLFFFRLLQTLFFLLFGSHFLTCTLYFLACTAAPGTHLLECKPNSWLRSFDDGSLATRYDVLGKTEGYLYSFYFACATISSAGFGDFNPQNEEEMIFLIFFELLSFCVTGYYTALLTSALSCTVRPKLVFQQKLIGIRQFMEHKGLAEALQGRIIEHYYLQDQLWFGVSLPPNTSHFMFDTPDYLQEDALYLEVELHFDGVPIFTKLDPKSTVEITKLMRRYLIPPGAIFLRKGEVRRQMYVIAKGSLGFMSDRSDQPVKILEETGHFGLRDLLFGEPAHHDIKTLSYCLLYEVELRDLMEALSKDTELLEIVEEEKAKLQKGIDAMIKEYSLHDKIPTKEKSQSIPSWIHFPTSARDCLRHCTFEEYEEVYEALNNPCIFRMMLMRRSVHPAGPFAKTWISFMSLISALTIVALVTESFMGLRTMWFRVFQLSLDIFNWIDIYIKFHWGYYARNNLLVSHPVQTAINYVFREGFLTDAVFSTPFELVVVILRAGNFFGNDDTAYWYSKFRWTRFGQILRFPAVIQIFHNIFKMRSVLLLLLYGSMTMLLGTAVSAIALSVACPIGHAAWSIGDENKMPFCSKDSWVAKKSGNALHGMWTRWIYGLYYVSQVMFVIGFGDMTTLSNQEIYLLIFMMLFGFIIMRCIVADLTAADVDIDEVRHKYLENLKCLMLIMAREKVHPKLVRNVKRHLYHAWDMSKGLQPRHLFADLHPALEADLFRDLVGEELEKVPIFKGFRENIQRTICQYMNTVFFRKGERIVHWGNTDGEMFIIVSGRVWITNKMLSWITTLSAGESFGEASVLYGTRREYNAVAASAVELFVLSADDFDDVLERYPAVEDELKTKLGNTIHDLFQQDLRRTRGSKIGDEEREKISAEIKELLYANEKPDIDEEELFTSKKEGFLMSLPRKVFGYGKDDQNLAFFYLAQSPGCRCPFLIHPNCLFMDLFDSLIVIISYATPCIAMYEICFFENGGSQTSTGHSIQDISWALEGIMYFHILFQFITPFVNVDGSHCKEFKKIAFNYATTLTAFPVDLIGSLPLVNSMIPNSGFWHSFWRYMYAVRFLRLPHYFRSQLKKKGDLSTSTFKYKITLSISSFMLMTHVLACIFYGLSSCACPKPSCADNAEDIRSMCVETTWTHQFVHDNGVKTLAGMASFRWYIRALYWVITTVSTTGFGDITPLNTNETVLAILAIFCGAFVLSIILSHFTSGTASLSKSAREYLYQVNLLTKHMGNIGMSQQRRDQVMSYFVMRWETSRGVRYHESTSILPSTLKAEVCYALYCNVVHKCDIFTRNLDMSFLRQLCTLFMHSSFIPGINVVNEGYMEKEEREEGVPEMSSGSMFLVFKGRISGYRHDTLGNPLLVKTYDVGKLFGRHSALFYDQPYNKTYRAETYSEVLQLSQKHLLQLINQYPVFAENVMTLIMRKYDPTEDNECIFEKKKVRKDLYEVAHEARTKMEGGEFRSEEPADDKNFPLNSAVNPIIGRLALADIEIKKTKANLTKRP